MFSNFSTSLVPSHSTFMLSVPATLLLHICRILRRLALEWLVLCTLGMQCCFTLSPGPMTEFTTIIPVWGLVTVFVVFVCVCYIHVCMGVCTNARIEPRGRYWVFCFITGSLTEPRGRSNYLPIPSCHGDGGYRYVTMPRFLNGYKYQNFCLLRQFLKKKGYIPEQ